jgi:hypothetical protein
MVERKKVRFANATGKPLVHIREINVEGKGKKVVAPVKKAWSPSMEIGRPADSYPIVPAEVRAREQHYLRRFITTGPILVWGNLYSAKVQGKLEWIPAIIEEDGAFGYKNLANEYVGGLHSFELIWHFRHDYALSGKVNYSEYIRCKQYFHCLQFIRLDGQKRQSIQRMVLSMLDGTAPASNSSACPSPSPSLTSRPPPGLSHPSLTSRPPPGLSHPSLSSSALIPGNMLGLHGLF